MAENSIIEVVSRDGVGKGAARQTRREGFVPGIVYGAGKDPVAIKVKQSELLRRLKLGKFLSVLHNLSIDGKEERVVCRHVQRDKVNDLPVHIDFLRLGKDARIAMAIPVEFINQDISVGLKRGGTLVVVRQEVELVVPADNIPDHLTIDLAKVNVGDVLHISNVELPAGCKPTITDRDFVIANISVPSGGVSEDTSGA